MNTATETMKSPASRPAKSTEVDQEKPSPLWMILGFVMLWLGGSGLVIGLAFQSTVPGGWTGFMVTGLLAAIPIWRLALGLSDRAYPSAATRLLVLRPFWYLMLFAPLIAAGVVIGALAGLPFGSSGEFARWSLAFSGPLVLVIAGVGYWDSRRLTVRNLEVSLPRLPREFDGLKVAQISDLHVGPHTPQAFLRRVRSTVESANPDLIAITGDQVDDFAEDADIFNEAFARLKAPLDVHVIPGNHDVYAGWSTVERKLREAGFSVLVNSARALQRGGSRLWIAGTGDPAGKGGPLGGDHAVAPDIDRTLADVPEGEPVIALAHNPALWPQLVRRKVDLTLSGHTHYGQLALPVLNWSLASVFLKYAMGSYREGDSLLYINPGTNFWGLPLRFGTPPEVTFHTLRAGSANGALIRDVGRQA